METSVWMDWRSLQLTPVVLLVSLLPLKQLLGVTVSLCMQQGRHALCPSVNHLHAANAYQYSANPFPSPSLSLSLSPSSPFPSRALFPSRGCTAGARWLHLPAFGVGSASGAGEEWDHHSICCGLHRNCICSVANGAPLTHIQHSTFSPTATDGLVLLHQLLL